MAQLKFFKVASLPGTPVADAFYFILNGNYAESYLTDSTGVAKMIGNSAMITALGGGGGVNEVQIVDNIAARNALTLTTNSLVLVKDATGDATVAAGAALYVWDNVLDTFSKISEYESLDAVISWANITGKPTSSAAAIDTAVTNSHTHANKAALDKIGEADGAMTYNGSAITSNWETTNW